MKIDIKNKNGNTQHLDVSSLIITLNNGETIEITDENKSRPIDIPEGVTVWGGRAPDKEARKKTTRSIGIYPLASNMVHIFPYSLKK
ncbi:hypothetical protein VXO23_08990 [Escherichia coli]|uniref:hypothetical protein n=1 Tax=Escherichia coli TaxID=562 RepID=UPI002FE0B9EA